MERLTGERAEALTRELTELLQQQSEALKTAAYFRMSPEEAHRYETRRQRISEISILLGKFKDTFLLETTKDRKPFLELEHVPQRPRAYELTA
jgi:hypothetical protein